MHILYFMVNHMKYASTSACLWEDTVEDWFFLTFILKCLDKALSCKIWEIQLRNLCHSTYTVTFSLDYFRPVNIYKYIYTNLNMCLCAYTYIWLWKNSTLESVISGRASEIFGELKEFLRVGGFFCNFEGFQQPEFKNISDKAWALTAMQLSLAVTDCLNMVLSII